MGASMTTVTEQIKIMRCPALLGSKYAAKRHDIIFVSPAMHSLIEGGKGDRHETESIALAIGYVDISDHHFPHIALRRVREGQWTPKRTDTLYRLFGFGEDECASAS